MKKILVLLVVFCLLSTGAFARSTSETGPDEYKIAWYASAVHPYFDAVKKGVEGYEEASGIPIHKQIGPDWTQDSENQGIEGLAAQGYKAFSVYPSDPSAANGLYEELTSIGISVVNFGASTTEPTPASFYVGTAIKDAAMQATEKLIELMGGSGNIVNVLEVITDANTILRKEGVEEVVAKYPNVKIIQEIADMTSIEEATEKIQNAMAGTINEVDGVICTGYTTTVAAAALLKEYHQSTDRRIRFVGIDDDPTVLEAIADGWIDATVSQNPYGHGYISVALLKYLMDGWTPKPGKYRVNAGITFVTKDNVDTYYNDLVAVTEGIIGALETEYLNPPN